jgi:predicted HicB family RNase H-like nuclease
VKKYTSDGRINTAIRIDPALHERLRVAADERVVSVNFLVTRAIEDYLNRLIPVEELTRRG